MNFSIRNLILALVAWSVAANAGADWEEASAIGVSADNAKRPIALFVRWDGVGTIPAISISKDTWVTIDLENGSQWCVSGDCITYQPNIPLDTKAIFLSGLLVITHPGGSVTCDLWANFRAPGSPLPATSYQMQTIEATPGAGQRSNAAVWVSVTNKQFQFYWHYTPLCPSLINLSLQAYIR